jgi:hypothetical protein
MNWIKLTNCWINLDTIVRVEFSDNTTNKSATLISIKPGGSDKTVLAAEDASILEKYFQNKS